jgi:hypothetical protein
VHVTSLVKWLVAVAVSFGWLALTAASHAAEEKVALCHAGLITLTGFSKHIEHLRGMTRYEPQDIDNLVAMQRKGGAEFFSSQIFVQEEQSGSGTFDLRTVHGINDAIDYRNVTAWTCRAEDYPIVYFIGFRVREIHEGTIFVSREKKVVNVISLKAIDADLEKHLKVKIFGGTKVLCRDLGTGCEPQIFYDRG